MKTIDRKVKYAKIHGLNTFIPGLGDFGSVLPSPNKSVKQELYTTEEGLCFVLQNGAVEALIPWPNIQLVVYEKEAPELKVVAKKAAEKVA